MIVHAEALLKCARQDHHSKRWYGLDSLTDAMYEDAIDEVVQASAVARGRLESNKQGMFHKPLTLFLSGIGLLGLSTQATARRAKMNTAQLNLQKFVNQCVLLGKACTSEVTCANGSSSNFEPGTMDRH